MNRRVFIKIMGKSTLGLYTSLYLSACKSQAVIENDSGMEQLLEGFNPFVGKNPNIRPPHSIDRTFYDNLKRHNAHAGISYDLPTDEYIVACAPGIVARAQDHRDAWELVSIKHGDTIGIVYYHMREGSRLVSKGDTVERGQPLAKPYASTGNLTKVQVIRRGFSKSIEHMRRNYNSYRETPDTYGPNHGFMEYYTGQKIKEHSIDEVTVKSDIQRDIVMDLFVHYIGPGAHLIPDQLWHISPGSEKVKWSMIQSLRLMEHRFKTNPNHFDLPPSKIEDMVQEFYRNQPLLLTLPLQALTNQ